MKMLILLEEQKKKQHYFIGPKSVLLKIMGSKPAADVANITFHGSWI
jgi:hypothetical protein